MATAIANLLSGGLLSGVSKVIDSIKGKSPEDAAKLAELTEKYNEAFLNAQITQRAQDLQELQAQTDINKVEAASNSLFVAGWRPMIGWVCGSGLAMQFIVGPFATWIATLANHPIKFPELDMGTLLTLLIGMLGLGGMRTAEKIKGVSSGH